MADSAEQGVKSRWRQLGWVSFGIGAAMVAFGAWRLLELAVVSSQPVSDDLSSLVGQYRVLLVLFTGGGLVLATAGLLALRGHWHSRSLHTTLCCGGAGLDGWARRGAAGG